MPKEVYYWNILSPKVNLRVWTQSVAIITICVSMVGCTTVGETTQLVVRNLNPVNWFEDDKEEEEEGLSSEKQRKSFPKLGSVPTRPRPPSPEEETKKISEGLTADSENARYTDRQLRQSSAVFGGRPKPPGDFRPNTFSKGSMRQGVSQNSAVAQSPDRKLATLTGRQINSTVRSTPTSTRGIRLPTATPRKAVTRPEIRSNAPIIQNPIVAPKTVVRQPVLPPQPLAITKTVSPAIVKPPQVGGKITRRDGERRLNPAEFVTPVGSPRQRPKLPPRPTPLGGLSNERIAAISRTNGVRFPSPGTVSTRRQPAAQTMEAATIYFKDGSSQLSTADRSILSAVAEAHRQSGGRIRVVGHSSLGAQTFNQLQRSEINYRISLQRANSVAKELIRQGVNSQNVIVVAEGDRVPMYAETSKVGAAYNRRAEIFIDN